MYGLNHEMWQLVFSCWPWPVFLDLLDSRLDRLDLFGPIGQLFGLWTDDSLELIPYFTETTVIMWEEICVRNGSAN